MFETRSVVNCPFKKVASLVTRVRQRSCVNGCYQPNENKVKVKTNIKFQETANVSEFPLLIESKYCHCDGNEINYYF